MEAFIVLTGALGNGFHDGAVEFPRGNGGGFPGGGLRAGAMGGFRGGGIHR